MGLCNPTRLTMTRRGGLTGQRAEARAQVKANLATVLAKATEQQERAVRRALAVVIAERLSQAGGQTRS